jgi:hypothetical protein
MKIRVKTATPPSKPETPKVKKVDMPEFRAALRHSIQTCPRDPNSPICGYGGMDGKGRPYDVCLLPTGHPGPHMHVELPEIDAALPRTLERSHQINVSFDFSETAIKRNLTDIMVAWKSIGNGWFTALEASLEVFSKGLRYEHSIDNHPALSALHFMGYMERQKERGDYVVRFRLSKKGLEAVSRIKELVKSNPTDDCTICFGSGYDDKASDVCSHCEGTGKEPGEKSTSVSSLPEKRVRIRAVKKDDRNTVVCGRCKGECVLPSGDVCDRCDGTGEVSGLAAWSQVIMGDKDNVDKKNSTTRTTVKARIKLRPGAR